MKKAKYYTLFLVTLPITSIYKSFIPMLSIADVLLLFLSIDTISNALLNTRKPKDMTSVRRNRMRLGSLILLSSFIFITLISMLIGDYYSLGEITKRILRFSLFMFTVSITGYYYFDFKTAIKQVTNISIFATVYIIIQTIAYHTFRKVLPFIVPFLRPVSTEYMDISFLKDWYSQFYYRPQSFFMEPAHFSQYVLIALALCLFWGDISGEKTRLKSAIFLSIGLVLSTSSIGVLMCAFIWGMYFLNLLKGKVTLKKINIFFALLFLATLLLPLLFQLDIINTSILRVFQATARTTDSYSLLSGLDVEQRLFGLGLGNESYYLGFGDDAPFINSFSIVLLTVGYTGFIIYLLFFKNLIFKRKSVFRVLALTLFILSSVSEIFFAYIGILYLLFIYYGSEKDN